MGLQAQALNDLLTLSEREPRAARRRLLAFLQRSFEEELVLFFQAACVDGVDRYLSFDCCGDRRASEFVESLAGRPMLRAPTLDLQYPDPQEVNRFVAQEYDSNLRRSEVYREGLARIDAAGTTRILIYDGDEFLGWLGLMRRPDQPAPDHEQLRELDRLSEVICAVVTTSVRQQRQRLDEEKSYAIFDAGGELRFASPQVRSWLTPERLEHLRYLVRGLDRGEVERAVAPLDLAEVRLARLVGERGSSYVAHFCESHTIQRAPDAALTPVQREVASYVVAGATNREIARAMEISTETVKTHLKNIYRRLHVASRLELAETLRWSDPAD